MRVCGVQSVGWTAEALKWLLKRPRLYWSRRGDLAGTQKLCLVSMCLGKCPSQPCYPEKTVLGIERCSEENYLSIPNCVDGRFAGPEERFFNRLILLRKDHACVNNEQEIVRVKKAIRKDARRRLLERWQTRWHGGLIES